MPSEVASLIAATADLQLVQSLIKAIDARAPGLSGPGHVERGVDRYVPGQVIHPEPRYLPRQVIHPTPRYLPRPIVHPTPRFSDVCSPPREKAPCNPIPSPFPPVWSVLPPAHPHPPAQILKIAAPRIDILNKGTLVDLFI